MSWLGLRHKGIEPLFPEEWNAVVDGLDILYGYFGESVKYSDLLALASDIIPDQDNVRDLGSSDRAWNEVYAYYGYFLGDAYVQGRRVLKDGDPVQTARFIDEAKADIERIYGMVVDTKTETLAELAKLQSDVDLLKQYVQTIYGLVRRPTSLKTQRIIVGATPVPLSDIDMVVRRIHVKVPSWAMYLVYVGDEASQDFVLEPGDKEVFEVENPRKVYVRSLGSVEIFIAYEA